MDSPQGVSRVIMVVLDGLRADATALFPLPHLGALARQGTATFAARTVHPSITAAAMTSLFTGVAPHVHGVRTDRFGLPRSSVPLTLLPRLLQQHGFPVHVFLHAIPRAYRGLASRIGSGLGAEIHCIGESAGEILEVASPVLDRVQRGVHFLHWPDADRAGHQYGWGSPEYVRAARGLDCALGRLVRETGVLDDPGTVLIAFADHGGGGATQKDHNSLHPLDTTIPVVLAGGQVVVGELAPLVSLLDIPATVAWALGISVPESYAGRPLIEAFMPSVRPVPPAAMVPAMPQAA